MSCSLPMSDLCCSRFLFQHSLHAVVGCPLKLLALKLQSPSVRRNWMEPYGCCSLCVVCINAAQSPSITQSHCCSMPLAAVQGRALRRKRREEAQREALLQAQKASYRHRSRFQRALGSTSAEAPAAELDGEEYDGLLESNFSQPAHRCIP